MNKKLSFLSILLLMLFCIAGTESAKAATTYKVYYDYQGGKSSKTYSTTYQTKTHGVNLTLRKDTPVKSGYVFLGYKTSKNAGNASYQPGGTYKLNSGITLYAMWAPSKYTITYDANGGSFSVNSAVKNYGKAYTVSQKVPTRTGYTFAGWGLTSTTKTVYVNAGGKLTANQNYKLYAIWTPNTYTVTYNYGNGNVVTEKRTYNQTYKVKTPHVTKEAYVVQGWSLNQNSTTVSIKTGDKITAAQNITLYPVWVLKTYKITLKYPITNVVDGKIQTTLSSVVVDKKHGINLDLNGYYNINHIRGTGVCVGWATSSTATVPTYTTTYTANKNATLYLITSNKFNHRAGGTVYYNPDYLNNERFYLNDAKYVDDNGNVIGNMFYNVPKTYKVVYMPYEQAVEYRDLMKIYIDYLQLLFGNDFNDKKHYEKLSIDTAIGQLNGTIGYDAANAIINIAQIENQYDELLVAKDHTTSQYNTLVVVKYIKILRELCGFVPYAGSLLSTCNTISGELDYAMQKLILESYNAKLKTINSCINQGYGLKLTYSMAQGLDQDVEISAWKNNYIYVNYTLKAGMNSDGSYSYTGTLYSNKVSYGKYDTSSDAYIDFFE